MTVEKRTVFETRSIGAPGKQGPADFSFFNHYAIILSILSKRQHCLLGSCTEALSFWLDNTAVRGAPQVGYYRRGSWWA